MTAIDPEEVERLGCQLVSAVVLEELADLRDLIVSLSAYELAHTLAWMTGACANAIELLADSAGEPPEEFLRGVLLRVSEERAK